MDQAKEASNEAIRRFQIGQNRNMIKEKKR